MAFDFLGQSHAPIFELNMVPLGQLSRDFVWCRVLVQLHIKKCEQFVTVSPNKPSLVHWKSLGFKPFTGVDTLFCCSLTSNRVSSILFWIAAIWRIFASFLFFQAVLVHSYVLSLNVLFLSLLNRRRALFLFLQVD